jgi:hypothetical protein
VLTIPLAVTRVGALGVAPLRVTTAVVELCCFMNDSSRPGETDVGAAVFSRTLIETQPDHTTLAMTMVDARLPPHDPVTDDGEIVALLLPDVIHDVRQAAGRRDAGWIPPSSCPLARSPTAIQGQDPIGTTGSAVVMVREVQTGQEDGVPDRDQRLFRTRRARPAAWDAATQARAEMGVVERECTPLRNGINPVCRRYRSHSAYPAPATTNVGIAARMGPRPTSQARSCSLDSRPDARSVSL